MIQPRARVNISCSRAGHKGATGGPEDHENGHEKTAAEDSEGWVPDQGTKSLMKSLP